MRTKPQARPPRVASDHRDDLAYRVWVIDPSIDMYDRYTCVAAYRFLQECLDFIGYCHSRETAIWFQSPTGVEHRPAPVRADPTNGD
jgi:hypothetical protein